MDLRARNENRSIKIGVIERFSNGKENAIKPFTMSGHSNPAWENHADNVIKVIRSYVPNAEIHLVPADPRGIAYLISHDMALINVSLASHAKSPQYDVLAEKAFICCGAGNDAEEGESWLSLQDYSCAVGAIDKNLKPAYYSSYGHKKIMTVCIEPVIDGETLRGTSFTSPTVVGLLAQWYIWFYNKFNCYPSIKATNNFIKQNSHDVFDDGFDERTGYGLLRLPYKFKAKIMRINTSKNTNMVQVEKHVEGEPVIKYMADLLEIPFIKNNRTFAPTNGFNSEFGITVFWDGYSSYYIQ